MLVMVQDVVDARRQLDEGLAQLRLDRAVDRAPSGGHRDRQAGKRGELGGERLGGGDADLGAGLGSEHRIRFAGHRALIDIDHRDDVLALRPGIAESGQRVGGLARLGHEQRHPARRQDGGAVAELGRDLDLDRDLREPGEPVFGDQPRVVGGAAGDDGHLADPTEIERHVRQGDDAVPRVEHAVQRISDHRRLLVDLLEHEMGEVSLADHRARGRGAPDLALDDVAVLVVDDRPVGPHLRPVALVEIADAAGQGRERERVGAEKHLALAIADRERAAAPRADHQVVVPGEQDGERERPFQPLERSGDRLLRGLSLAQTAADQMHRRFGVGVGREDMAGGGELAAQLLEVLDDAVMHQHHVLVGMRVRVVDGRQAVGGPARVPDPDRAGERLPGDHPLEPGDLAFGPTALDTAVDQGGDAGGIVAPVFEPPQPVDQKRRDLAFADDADDAAHRPGPIDPMSAWRSGSAPSSPAGEPGTPRPSRS